VLSDLSSLGRPIGPIAGVETGTGPDLALAQESAHHGVRGLPDMFGRLPQLEALLE
jgi:hypothetical protein